MNALNVPIEGIVDVEVSSFEIFDLTVTLGPGGYPWISAQSSAGFLHGVPRNDTALKPLDDLIDMIYDYSDSVSFAEPEPHPELAEQLRILVFGDSMVLQLFLATRGIAADRGSRLLFRILASPHLASLPWELLPDPSLNKEDDREHYLALAPDVQIVRMARGRAYSTRRRPLAAPINLLLVLSSPVFHGSDGRYDFDVFEVKRNLLDELAPLIRAGLLRVDIEDRPSIERLRRRIASQQHGYHIFHYVGHASPDLLVLEDPAGQAEDISSERLVELLRLCPDLQLAVFAGCETARSKDDPIATDKNHATGWRDMLSLADRFVQGVCPNVIGMQALLPLSTERIFTRFFYQGLATGYSIVDALRLARGAIHGDDRVGRSVLDWSVPVLFVGGNYPSQLLRRDAVTNPVVEKRPTELKLGLKQSAETFLARDLALRQSVEILTGREKERLLMITGPMGTGKTMLIDRALEEITPDVDLVLYVHASKLVPEFDDACYAIDDGRSPSKCQILDVDPDAAIRRLCAFTEELLRKAGHRYPQINDNLEAIDRWERLVGELCCHRSVLVLDEAGQTDHLQSIYLRTAVGLWLGRHVKELISYVGMQEAERHLEKLSADLQQRIEDLEQGRPDSQGELDKGLESMAQSLHGLPSRLLRRLPSTLSQVIEDWMAPLLLDVKDSEEFAACMTAWVRKRTDCHSTEEIIGVIAHLEKVRELSAEALRILIERRTGIRAALLSPSPLRDYFDPPAKEVFELRLAHLTWNDTWRWIRRSLPNLLKYGDAYLSRIWTRIGPDIGLWEALEREVARANGADVSLEEKAKELAPHHRGEDAGFITPKRWRRCERALRIAVAGPFMTDSVKVAEALTQMAISHGIGGRVVSGRPATGALAVLIEEESPFLKQYDVKIETIIAWLKAVMRHKPDIVLLDYGQPVTESAMREHQQQDMQAALVQGNSHRTLFIGAGGNKHQDDGEPIVFVPAAYDGILSVGPAYGNGKLKDYAVWSEKLNKPDLFMEDDLSSTPLASTICQWGEIMENPQGASFAALHAVAAAVLAWSMLPHFTPRRIRGLLESASSVRKDCVTHFLTVNEAVEKAREELVKQALRGGPCTKSTLSALTGLEMQYLDVTVKSLLSNDVIETNRGGRLERIQLVQRQVHREYVWF
jgi:hypothetical protein